MSRHHYIFDTQQESDQCRQECYDAYMLGRTEIDFINNTLAWSEEQTRLTDNKYIVPYCDELGDNGYTIENSTSAWFPEGEY